MPAEMDLKRFSEILGWNKEKESPADEGSMTHNRFFEIMGWRKQEPPTPLIPAPSERLTPSTSQPSYLQAEPAPVQGPKEESDDDVRMALAKALQTKVPERGPSDHPLPALHWDRWWENTKDRVSAARRFRDAETEKEKNTAIKDYAKALADFRSDPNLIENVKFLSNPKYWSKEQRGKYNTRLNAIAVKEADKEVFNWMTTGSVTAAPSDKELLEQFNRRNKTNYK